jgi:hypothetical protein
MYALKYAKGGEVIKIKGYNQNNMGFVEFKECFYSEKNIINDNVRILNKHNWELEENYVRKIFSTSNYDKRKTSEDKKQTSPYTFINYKYY